MTRSLCILALFAMGCLAWEDVPNAELNGGDGGSDNNGNNGTNGIDWQQSLILTIPETLAPSADEVSIPLAVVVPDEFAESNLDFRDANGDSIPFERNGGVWWVNVDQVNAGSETVVQLWTSESNSKQYEASEVWANGYVAVWHFEEELGTDAEPFQPYFLDTIDDVRCDQEKNFQNSLIDPSFFGNGVHSSRARDSAMFCGLQGRFPTEMFTIDLWLRVDATSLSNFNSIFGVGMPGYALYAVGENAERAIYGQINDSPSSSTKFDLQDDTWFKLAGILLPVSSRREIQLYSNGELMDSDDVFPDFVPGSTAYKLGSGRATLAIDELRISSVVRSADWLRLQYLAESQMLFEITRPN